METFLWMLQQAAIPFAIGSTMAFTTSKWSRWSGRKKASAALVYQIILLIGSFFEIIEGHALLRHCAVQLRSGVFAAFGIGLSIAQGRFGSTLWQRAGAVVFFLLHVGVLWMRFESEIISAFNRLIR